MHKTLKVHKTAKVLPARKRQNCKTFNSIYIGSYEVLKKPGTKSYKGTHKNSIQ